VAQRPTSITVKARLRSSVWKQMARIKQLRKTSAGKKPQLRPAASLAFKCNNTRSNQQRIIVTTIIVRRNSNIRSCSDNTIQISVSDNLSATCAIVRKYDLPLTEMDNFT
jgi:hypothetical protein